MSVTPGSNPIPRRQGLAPSGADPFKQYTQVARAEASRGRGGTRGRGSPSRATCCCQAGVSAARPHGADERLRHSHTAPWDFTALAAGSSPGSADGPELPPRLPRALPRLPSPSRSPPCSPPQTGQSSPPREVAPGRPAPHPTAAARRRRLGLRLDVASGVGPLAELVVVVLVGHRREHELPIRPQRGIGVLEGVPVLTQTPRARPSDPPSSRHRRA